MCSRKSPRCSFERIEGLVVTPLTKPRCNACSSSSRLAVSMNSFIPSLLLTEDPAHRLGQIGGTAIRRTAVSAAVRLIQQDRAAAGGPSRGNIAPAIADQEAALQVESPTPRGGQEHPRLWLATVTTVGGIVVA